ncbi:MAG: hypothetical protein ABSC64_01885 [Candidatus Korobacteraceae bacterium]|jgi:hypothetical protein
MPENQLPRAKSLQLLTSPFSAIFLVLLLFGLSWSQTTPSQPQSNPPPQSPNQAATPSQPAAPQTHAQPPNPSGATQVPGAGVSVQNRQQGSTPSPSAQQPEPQTRITKVQAKELFRSVDEILDFASHDTGLPIQHKVKRNLITRESVERYVDKRMKDDKDAQRLEQSRLVLEKFGLLPPGYDLHSEFLRLLGEQVAAYYDPKSKSVNLLDWVQPDIQKPVLAHELTHALQDQKINLEKWELAGAKDQGPQPDQQEQVAEEAQAARQCVTEGQAMVVLVDYTLAPIGKDILTAPEIVDVMRGSMADNKDSPVFAAAPMFLRESLLMPYTFGLEFVRAVLAAKGKDAAYPGMLENPPIDTRQIMQPETYLRKQNVPPLAIPDLDKLVAPDYERFDFGGMGEFDIYLLAKQYGGAPPNYYPHWRGGYYFAARAKSTPKEQIAMLYFSRWDSPEAARDFAKLYADYLPKRYKKATLQQPAPVSAMNSTGAKPAITFETNEGKVTLEIQGSDLLILEGLDDAVADRASEVLLHGMSLPQAAGKSSK